ncbi:MAG: Glutamate--methylamine ligase, partial [Mycobacterium sp.]|nr:Glutamate--methylamine ligase [Mycobacterium sp.]
LVGEVFSPGFVSDYAEMKQNEWDAYHGRVSDWERERYLLDV